jgi:hypothetical protein
VEATEVIMIATHQLVLQFSGDAVSDLDALVAIENLLIEALQESADVDGHDIGTGESNIFIHATNPALIFQKIQPVLIQTGVLSSATVAYRLLDGGNYTVLWPKGSTKPFKIV